MHQGEGAMPDTLYGRELAESKFQNKFEGCKHAYTALSFNYRVSALALSVQLSLPSLRHFSPFETVFRSRMGFLGLLPLPRFRFSITCSSSLS
jgi:hypothetical protein